MLFYNFNNFLLTVFFCFFIINLWAIYYIYTNTITVPPVLSTDIKRKKTIDLNGNVFIVIFNLLCIWIWLTNYVYIHNINIQLVLWDTIYVSNNTLSYFCILMYVLVIILLSSMCLFNQNISFTVEYLLFVLLIVFAGFFLLSSTNLLLTIFLLELVALLIFGKFAVSRILFKKNPIDGTNKKTNTPQFSYGLFNSLFFQFWANFVSSIFLFFSLINLHYMFGTSNFFFLNLFILILNYNSYFPEIFITFALNIFTTGLFIKFGLSPYQFFKIETYKGIPLYMIIVYTTLYLIIYVYFFLFLYLNQIPSIKNFTGTFILIFISISIFYLVNLLFDTKNFKAFLSYSTLITLVNIFIISLIL